MVSNLVPNALESHAQVFSDTDRVRPFASLRQVKLGDVLFSADDSDVPFFILLSGKLTRRAFFGSNLTANLHKEVSNVGAAG
jgi:hypothetical protein